jgi:hypothetical protein
MHPVFGTFRHPHLKICVQYLPSPSYEICKSGDAIRLTSPYHLMFVVPPWSEFGLRPSPAGESLDPHFPTGIMVKFDINLYYLISIN